MEQDGMELAFVRGVAQEVYRTLIYHKSEIDREEFEKWLQGEGGDLFTEYQKKLKKTHARICFSCKYFDMGKDQCFDGHIQREDMEECEGYEKCSQTHHTRQKVKKSLKGDWTDVDDDLIAGMPLPEKNKHKAGDIKNE